MSCDDIAISVKNLSKCFQIYDKPRDRLMQMFMRSRKKYYREFWALKDVSFDIRRGETVGIVGRNGSGKSTLLQIICGTLNPTGGSVTTRGRIAALLELGSGFNPEFTGKENVYLNATVLGLTEAEIDARFDEIVAFADIGDFISQPVKTYSSGMMVRLAFAVAINVDPEILIVDEALSVGDELFQRKCFARIEAIRAKGATILFVSHSGSTIVDLCDTAILMDAGDKLLEGAPKQIVGRYQKLLYAPADKQDLIREQIRRAEEVRSNSATDAAPNEHAMVLEQQAEEQESFDSGLKPTSTIEYESRGAYIEKVEIRTLGDKQVNNLIRGRTYRYVYFVRVEEEIRNMRFGMLIKTLNGIELGGAASARSFDGALAKVAAGAVYKVEFRFTCSLNPGVYFLNAGVTGELGGDDTYLHRLIDIAMFRVQSNAADLATGIVDFGCYPEIELQ
ncbi:lipopolysaccharide transport system ATP-binding protein [Janthinobacterium sp. 67]|uniref:ABC transporter ATP-binding protein n=1 Tax=Janthinobacterium sp. 67 TaxID=2035207 RepID=UPI000CC146AA|nr:ABC transporter ATP-binding protein [Janthinobacterium sp. 67]PJJ19564.1 lipopolysaccharide transport system ATP-binding protein [Janthinobacterium sp. 67]